MTAPQLNIRITGKNSDGEYWLHIDGMPQKAGFNLGEPKGMIASALLMAASGHTYTRSDLIPNAAYVAALEAALRDMLQSVCGPTGFAEAVRHNSGHAYPWHSLDAAEAMSRAALSARPATPDVRVVTDADLRGAIGLAWCHEENVAKEMDIDLAEAVLWEIRAIIGGMK